MTDLNAGLCSECGNNAPALGHRRCLDCLADSDCCPDPNCPTCGPGE